MSARLRHDRRLFTTREVAELTGLSPQAIRKARREGRINAIDLNADKPDRTKPRYRYAARELRKLGRG